MSQPVVPCALEFIDGNAIDMIRQYSQSDLPEHAGAMLMIEVDGQREGLGTAAEKVAAAANNDGLLDIRLAQTDAEVKALWQTRKALSPALRKVAPKKINEDVVVPVTEMPALIAGLGELSKKYDLAIIILNRNYFRIELVFRSMQVIFFHNQWDALFSVCTFE